MVVSEPPVQLQFAIWLSTVSDRAHYTLNGIEVHFIAAFHDAIVRAVPQILESLKNKDWYVRSAGANAIGKVAEHGK